MVIGASVAHYKVTAGTLGCFVEAGDGNICILSNNHVLANENDAQTGDPILQPGPLDGGQDPGDLVARLESFVPLKTGAANTVDCAIAAVESGVDLDLATLTGLGTLSGSLQDISDSSTLAKVGRTTGATRGSITAFEVDGVVVSYGIGSLTFDQQIEIDNVSGPFSNGGDSGSLIVDDSGKAVALLFAGSDQGGNKGLGLTYGNHIDNVLNALNVRLKFN